MLINSVCYLLAAMAPVADGPAVRAPLPDIAPAESTWLVQAGGDDLVVDDRFDTPTYNLLYPSNRGTYIYLKGGFGISGVGSFEFENAPLAELGFTDVTQRIATQDAAGNERVLAESALLRQFTNEGGVTTIEMDPELGPTLVAGGGLDISFGRNFLGNRFRPRVEAEYAYQPANLGQLSAPISFRDALRDPTGGIILLGNEPNQQTVLGNEVTIQQPLGETELTMHTVGANVLGTFEVAPRVRPYAGLGAGYTFASVEIAGEEYSDSALQFTGLGGVIISISEEFELDLGGRYSTVDLELIGDEVSIDTWAFTLLLNVRL